MVTLFSTLANPIMEYKVVQESSIKDENKVIAEVIFQKAEDTNQNGHRFKKSVLCNAINEIQESAKSRHFLGELDHPENIKDINRIGTVMLEKASHVIPEISMDGNYVVGKLETLKTPKGLILNALLRDNIKLGVSIRALTEQEISYGMSEVDTIDSFSMVAYDAVHNPAYKDAYVTGLISSITRISDDNKEIKKYSESDMYEIIGVIAEKIAHSIYMKQKGK